MRGKINRLLDTKFPLLIGVTCALLVAFLAYTSTSAYVARRNGILAQLNNELNNGAKNLNRLYEVNIQKVTIIDQNYQIQNYLRSQRKLDLFEGSMDFFENLKTIYFAISDGTSNWRLWKFSIYSMNDNILKGSFIRDISELEPGMREKLLSAPRNTFIWEYNGNRSGWVCIYKVNTLPGGSSVTIDELQIGVSTIRVTIEDEMSESFPVVYMLNGTVPIILNASAWKDEPIPADAEHTDWLAGFAKDYYILESHLTINNDYLLAFIPKASIREELAGLFAGWVSGIVISLVLSGIFILAIVYRIKEHFKLVADIQTEKKQLELELAQSLINPHLLYNSLGGIKYAYSDKKLAKVIDSMVNFYRIALSRGNNMLPIDQEAEMTRLYLEIQKFTYETDFTYSVQIDPDIEKLMILKNLIQPIVENAFLHGIKKQSPSERISLSGRRVGDDIVFTVSDNGVGMDSAKLDSLNGMETGLGGYGLRNIQKRVELHYGKGYGISVQSEDGIGTTVTLRIPFPDETRE